MYEDKNPLGEWEEDDIKYAMSGYPLVCDSLIDEQHQDIISRYEIPEVDIVVVAGGGEEPYVEVTVYGEETIEIIIENGH